MQKYLRQPPVDPYYRSRKKKLQRKRKLRKQMIYFCSQIMILGVLFLLLYNIATKTDNFEQIFEQVEQVMAEEFIEQPKEDPSLAEIPELVVYAPVNYSIDEAYQLFLQNAQTDTRYAQICEKFGDYPENLLLDLANNPEMISFVSEYQGIQYDIAKQDLSKEEQKAECPLFLQFDHRWGYQTYGDASMIAVSGCGPTSLAMVAVGLTHNYDINPGSVADYAMKQGYYVSGTGTSWNLMTDGAAHFGLNGISINYDADSIKDALRNGAYIICSMRKGDFTNAGHFIVIYDDADEGFCINDPFCLYRSNQKWNEEQICNQIKAAWALYPR